MLRGALGAQSAPRARSLSVSAYHLLCLSTAGALHPFWALRARARFLLPPSSYPVRVQQAPGALCRPGGSRSPDLAPSDTCSYCFWLQYRSTQVRPFCRLFRPWNRYLPSLVPSDSLFFSWVPSICPLSSRLPPPPPAPAHGAVPIAQQVPLAPGTVASEHPPTACPALPFSHHPRPPTHAHTYSSTNPRRDSTITTLACRAAAPSSFRPAPFNETPVQCLLIADAVAHSLSGSTP